MAEQPSPESSPFEEPQHEDYGLLLAIVESISLQVEANPELTIEKIFGDVVDAQSATFAALARAMAYLDIKSGAEMMQRMDEAMRMAMFWIEGLHVGVIFHQSKQNQKPGES